MGMGLQLGLNSSGDELLKMSIVRLIINEILGIKKWKIHQMDSL